MQRGDVYRFKVPKGGGREQQGERFGVVAPTSRSAKPASFRPKIEVTGDLTRVLVEQLGAVDVQRLGRRVCRLTVEEMWSVDEALMVVLGLD